MRHLILAAALIAALATVATAGVGAFVGPTVPMGDLADTADTGYHVGANMGFPVVPLVLSVGPMIVYHDLGGPSADDSFTWIEALATAKASLPAGPTITAGVGFAMPGGQIGGIDVDADNEIAWVFGTGTSVLMLEFNALWHHLGDHDMITVSAGLGF